MAKKYLLYIHDPLFEKEPAKSDLVNNLLERHYHDSVGGKTQNQILDIIKTKQDAVKVLKSLNEPRQKVKLCAHSNPKGFCFDKTAVRLKCNI
jgi:hypothetical protein